MQSSAPRLLALDFDGVLLDGLIEYFQTAWRTYCQVWPVLNPLPPEGLAERFYPLRAVVESGWEMPILLRALIAGIPEEKLWQDWPIISQSLLVETRLQAVALGDLVDQTRDAWIAQDLETWLGLHRFYPGVCDRVNQLLAAVEPDPSSSPNTLVYIVTTKEKRFVQKLLHLAGVSLPESAIFGRELRRPKPDILRELLATHGGPIWFIEDRLKTLQAVEQQPDLAAVRLFLADWGYNTNRDRAIAQASPTIQLLSLKQFAGSFDSWEGKAEGAP